MNYLFERWKIIEINECYFSSCKCIRQGELKLMSLASFRFVHNHFEFTFNKVYRDYNNVIIWVIKECFTMEQLFWRIYIILYTFLPWRRSVSSSIRLDDRTSSPSDPNIDLKSSSEYWSKGMFLLYYNRKIPLFHLFINLRNKSCLNCWIWNTHFWPFENLRINFIKWRFLCIFEFIFIIYSCFVDQSKTSKLSELWVLFRVYISIN